jgi:hypothetical protein
MKDVCTPVPEARFRDLAAVRWGARSRQLNRPWVAYLAIFLLQLKVVWGWWIWSDLTSGDTSAYFLSAFDWFESLRVNIVWSPLYTALYGTCLFLTRDVYAATVLHRLLIVVSASLLVLALLRRLLPPGLAWLVAAWWAVLPINFHTLYEVHLFALLPILAVWLLIQWRDSSWSRASALALVCLCSVLVRNELVVAAGLLGAICLFWEITKARGIAPPHGWASTLRAYGFTLALAACIVLVFYGRSTVKGNRLRAEFSAKHTVNMGQVFAFGYQQRHPEWNRSPWLQFQELTVAYFGKELPTLRQMIAANPQAVWDHFWWNLGLTGNGLQLLLFNATSGRTNPDYVPCNLQKSYPLWLSIGCAAVWSSGLCLLLRERRFWWDYWLRERALTWLAMLAAASVALVVIPTQRPRPSYLFSLSVLVMAWTGMSVYIIIRRFNWLKRFSAAMPLAMVGLILAAPCYFQNPAHRHPQRLRLVVERLKPFQAVIASPQTVFLKGEYAHEARNYLGRGVGVSYGYSLLDKWNSDISLDTFLEKRGVNLFFVDEALIERLSHRANEAGPFLSTAGNSSWKLIGFEDVPGCSWRLFERVRSLEARSASKRIDRFADLRGAIREASR